jgi:hypothetical protein
MNDAEYRRTAEQARRLAFENATRSMLKPKERLLIGILRVFRGLSLQQIMSKKIESQPQQDSPDQ